VVVRAAGGVLWRPAADGAPDDAAVQVAVVHRPRYDDWSLPKGKAQPGEHLLQTAVREVAEETGHVAVAGRSLGTSRYRVLQDGRETDKTVAWWSLQCRADGFAANDEVDALRWLPVPQARALLTAGRDAHVLDAFASAPPALDLLLLLRHARAGRRDGWDGDDDLRPLDDRGVAQADRLAALLPLLGVRRLVAAPPLRCRATLAPLAARLGLPVEVEPLLADAGVAARPDDAEALVRALPPGTAVCGQGEGLPVLLARLGAPAARLRKGDGRALWSAPGDVLVSADALPRD
jgi:8-oxo-(d)GTP phosphatase